MRNDGQRIWRVRTRKAAQALAVEQGCGRWGGGLGSLSAAGPMRAEDAPREDLYTPASIALVADRLAVHTDAPVLQLTGVVP